MKIKVGYPSGTVFHLSGDWKGPGMLMGKAIVLIFLDEDCLAHDFPLSKGSIFAGDIRGVYMDEVTHEVLYNPRDWMLNMEDWAVKWLGEHLEWPRIYLD